ncbi:MAG TPA: histidinol dehydrogenase [Chthoniobacterales bacterium]|nr:histidinol dehydrogenase [Chthoniobacterales bacterium]
MKYIELNSEASAASASELNRRYIPNDRLIQQVHDILDQVRLGGDEAILRLIARFDHTVFSQNELKVDQSEINNAAQDLDPEFRDAFQTAKHNVQEFASKSRRTDWLTKNEQGAEVGEYFHPFQRVGIYVPAGTAPLVSSAIMTVSLAAVVAVPEIVVVSPVGPDKKMNQALLAALHLAGATEIFKVGGAQAIGALAFGTSAIPKVDKIFGPGNAYVTEAKRQVFGYVAVDLLPGPSEILVLADSSAEPAWLAADLLAQAEHGPGSVICLVSPNRNILEATCRELAKQMETLSRREYLEEVVENRAYAVLTSDIAQAIRFANEFAPEHLSIVTEDPVNVARQVRNAGAIFLGPYSPVVAGDFLAGPSHELPTGGAGKSFAGLTVDQFQRRTSVVSYSPEALRKSLPMIEKFSAAEHLEAHGRSARIRFSMNTSERQ